MASPPPSSDNGGVFFERTERYANSARVRPPLSINGCGVYKTNTKYKHTTILLFAGLNAAGKLDSRVFVDRKHPPSPV